MVYGIKEHEVQRLSVILKSLGWEIVDKKIDERDITLTIHRHLSDQLLKAGGDLKTGSSG